MVHSAAHSAILPTGMLQARQLIKLLANPVWRPTFLGECEIPVHVRSTLHKLRLKVLDCRGDLLIDLTTHSGGAEEDGVAEQSDGDVDIADAAEEAVAAERVEGLACVAENEEYKYDVADPSWRSWCLAMMIVAGNRWR